ncbi:TonB-dependent receptor [Roseiterribacter gracilis]|uniref:TonB-dependent receptor n=1 Tax=Roseiterribacter gracilis TaxID=2812848 RepID=A0A8S8X7J1_9PROT|nr:TonB-dependent receptor [Rhodospirillales bacterium TMPK1]
MRGSLRIALLTGTVLGCCEAAFAQSTAPEEIMVTAQKRSERLQDVSAQVDVLTAATLDALHIKNTPDIVATIPNLTIAHTDTYRNSTITLRSISQANNSDQPVAIIIDGVPQDDAKQFNQRLYDIAQIEVLKGPQGSLYGRNAEAGAIIITTKAPTNELSSFANVSYGNGNTVDASAGVSGAIVPDKVLFRFAGNFSRSDGVIENTFRHDKSDYVDHDWSLRGGLEVRFTDKVKLNLNGQFGDFKAGTTYFAAVLSGNANDFQKPQSNYPGVSSGQQLYLSAKLEADLDFATFSSVTGFARMSEHQFSDVDFTNPVRSPTVFQVLDTQPSSNRTVSQELRLTGPSGQRLRWLISGDYLESKQLLSTNIVRDAGNFAADPYNPAFLLVSNAANNSRRDFGVGGQVDYDVLEKLTLSAGLRYDTDKRDQTNLNNGQHRSAEFDRWQPKVTATYKFTPTQLVYATYGVGFRAGGFNQPNYAIPIFAPETLRNFEVGVKTQWFDRKLTVNAAAFTGNVANYQFSFIDFATATPATGTIDKVRITGGEVEVRFTPMTGLNLFANLGVSIPEITKYSRFPQFVGNRTPRAAEQTVQAGFDYATPIANGMLFVLRANLQHDSDRYWFVDNLDVQKPKTFVHGSFGLEGNGWTATVWGRNIFDTKSYDTFFPNVQTGAGRAVAFPTKPAVYGVEFSYRY